MLRQFQDHAGLLMGCPSVLNKLVFLVRFNVQTMNGCNAFEFRLQTLFHVSRKEWEINVVDRSATSRLDRGAIDDYHSFVHRSMLGEGS